VEKLGNARGEIVEKSKKNRRRIVEIFGECRPGLFMGSRGERNDLDQQKDGSNNIRRDMSSAGR
jgi:hypothetical protein